jgi:FixJ family two-component response regulator
MRRFFMATPSGEFASSNAAILCVVDGDEDERDSVASVLERLDRPVRSFASGEELLEALGQTSLILLIAGVRLPGMSGIELLRKIRSKGIIVPTILISDDGDVPMAVDAMQAGAVDFLERPFVDRVLLRKAESALDKEIRR